MHPGLRTSQNHSQKSSTIQDAADTIMSLVEQERMQERQISTATAEAYYRELLEDYQKRSCNFHESQTRQLTQCQQELAETRIKFSDLQNRKIADDAMLGALSTQNQALKDECNTMRQKMTEVQNLAYMSGAEACHNATVLGLKGYGITYWGPNSLSFEEPWLRLWNQYDSEDPQNIISSDHRISQGEMENLLENFICQLRRDRESIQALEQHLSELRHEPDFRSRLSNKYTKVPSFETKTDVADENNDAHDDEKVYQATHFIKSEPGLEFSSL